MANIYFHDKFDYTTIEEFNNSTKWVYGTGSGEETLSNTNDLSDCTDNYGVDLHSTSADTIVATNTNINSIIWVTYTCSFGITLGEIITNNSHVILDITDSINGLLFRLYISRTKFFEGGVLHTFAAHYGEGLTHIYDLTTELDVGMPRTTFKIDIGMNSTDNTLICYINNTLVINYGSFPSSGVLITPSIYTHNLGPNFPLVSIPYYHREIIISDERVFIGDKCLGEIPPTVPPGQNKSILFDGHESIANPPASLSELLANSAFTIEGWVKLPLNYYHADDLIIADIKDKFSLYIEGTTGDLKFSHGATVEDLTDKLLDNVRYYFTITSDKTTTKVWLNSYVVGEYTTTEVIGSADIISICDFLGRGDNFAFYDKVLTEEQIKKHYGSGRCAAVISDVNINNLYVWLINYYSGSALLNRLTVSIIRSI